MENRKKTLERKNIWRFRKERKQEVSGEGQNFGEQKGSST